MALGTRTRTTASPTPKGDGRRIAILNALADAVAEKPLRDVSVAELTARAGVTRPAFYFYFPTKAAAVTALLEDVRGEMLAVAARWYAGGPGAPGDRLREGMRSSIAFWRGRAALFAAVLDAAAVDPTTAAAWAAWVDEWSAGVAARVEADAGPRLRAAGGPGAADLAAGLVGMVFHLMERDVRSLVAGGPGVPALEDVLVHTWSHAIYGEGE